MFQGLVQNLIDYGYLDNNVVNSNISEKETVNKEDYIYIEKDINTKAEKIYCFIN